MIDFIAGSMSNSGTTFAFGQSRQQQTTYRQTIFSIYAQDTYHLTPRLTANIGLRWEPMLFQVDKFGRGSNFSQAAFNANQHSTVFPNAPAGSFFYGDPGVPKSFTDNRYANLSPRVSAHLRPHRQGQYRIPRGSRHHVRLAGSVHDPAHNLQSSLRQRG